MDSQLNLWPKPEEIIAELHSSTDGESLIATLEKYQIATEDQIKRICAPDNVEVEFQKMQEARPFLEYVKAIRNMFIKAAAIYMNDSMVTYEEAVFQVKQESAFALSAITEELKRRNILTSRRSLPSPTQ